MNENNTTQEAPYTIPLTFEESEELTKTVETLDFLTWVVSMTEFNETASDRVNAGFYSALEGAAHTVAMIHGKMHRTVQPKPARVPLPKPTTQEQITALHKTLAVLEEQAAAEAVAAC